MKALGLSQPWKASVVRTYVLAHHDGKKLRVNSFTSWVDWRRIYIYIHVSNWKRSIICSGRLSALTSTFEATQVGAAALLRQLQSIPHHLRRERRGLELVAHAILVHAPHHVAALGAGRRRPSSLNGAQARIQRIRVAHTRSAAFRRHGQQHHQHAKAHQSNGLGSCHRWIVGRGRRSRNSPDDADDAASREFGNTGRRMIWSDCTGSVLYMVCAHEWLLVCEIWQVVVYCTGWWIGANWWINVCDFWLVLGNWVSGWICSQRWVWR